MVITQSDFKPFFPLSVDSVIYNSLHAVILSIYFSVYGYPWWSQGIWIFCGATQHCGENSCSSGGSVFHFVNTLSSELRCMNTRNVCTGSFRYFDSTKVVWSLNDWCKLPLTVPELYEIHSKVSIQSNFRINCANHTTYNNTLIRSYINFTSFPITLWLTLKLMSWLIIRNLFTG